MLGASHVARTTVRAKTDELCAALRSFYHPKQAAFFQSQAFRLTPAELDELRRGIEALVAPLRRADADDPPEGAAPVRVLVFGFPQVTEDTDDRTS